MIADWIDEELRNWARWCWSGEFPGPRHQERAASAEGRYLPPSDLGDEPEQPRIRPNRERAERVHHVYLTQLDTRERRVICLRYVDRWPAKKIPRLMRISEAMFEAAMIQAGRRVGEAFRSADALCD